MTKFTRPLFVRSGGDPILNFDLHLRYVKDDLIENIQWDPSLKEVINGAKQICPLVKFIYKIETQESPGPFNQGERTACPVIHIEFNTLEEAIEFDFKHGYKLFYEMWIG